MKKLISKIIEYLFIIGIIVLFIFAISNSKTDSEKRIELKNKGYNETQIDSILKKEEDDYLWAILNLAG